MGKTLQELTLKDNFMFAAVMADSENCRELLEMVLGIKIAKIHVWTEKTVIYNPAAKSVRLDIVAEDEMHTHYDVEMQVEKTDSLRRARYYHCQMDTELLAAGQKYNQLPDAYVIFICDYDPFGKKMYQYTVKQTCVEAPELNVDAGTHTIFLSTKGKNDDDISEVLRKFLKFVGSELENSEDDYGDAYVEKLQYAINKVKHDRELGERYMLFQELLDEREEKGRVEGRKEGIIEGRAEGKVEEIFSSVFCNDYSMDRGAEKLNLPITEFTEKYNAWLRQKEQS